MSTKRRCIHFWRRRSVWWSRTNQKHIAACRPCRRKWAREDRDRLMAKRWPK